MSEEVPPHSEPLNESSEALNVGNKSDESGEPLNKRPKVEQPKCYKLEGRLENILCCVVCLDLPACTVFQCPNGHLMCAGCYSRLLADARIRNEDGKCPTCRVECKTATRNLAVENALSEFPSECRFCGKEYPRKDLPQHETNNCNERLVQCKFSLIGCSWSGKHQDSMQHEQECGYPELSGKEIMESLTPLQKNLSAERKLFDSVLELLSYEKITFNDIQLRPYHSDEYIHKIYYETSRFTSYFHQWVVKTRIKASQADATRSCERMMTYQLSLKTSPNKAAPIIVSYMAVRGPFGNMKVEPRIYKFEFTETERDTPFEDLPLEDSAECNRLLSSRNINFRLIMFIVSK